MHIIAHDYSLFPVDDLKYEWDQIESSGVFVNYMSQSQTNSTIHIKFNQDYLMGDLCDSCWGKDKPFGDYPTPKTVNALFKNIWPCPEYAPAPNEHFTLIQDPDTPCHFSVEVADWLNGETLAVHWWARTNGVSTLSAFLQPSGSSYFLKNHCICEVSFKNSHTECDEPDIIGYEGAGLIIF